MKLKMTIVLHFIRTTCVAALIAPIICGLVYGQNAKQAQPADGALLNTFETLCKKMSDVKGNYTVAGIININDHAQPAGNMDDVSFLFCKEGDDFYYKLGTTVTLNAQGVYLFIDQKTKNILISPKKQVAYDTGLKELGDIGTAIQSENYQLVSKIDGDEQTLSLINEHHISCKQYSVTFNLRTMQVYRLYLRMSGSNGPLRTDNEKVVEVRLSQWDHTADISKYLTKNEVVKNINGRWKAVNEFKSYHLTSI